MTRRTFELSDGDRGIDQTVAEMMRLAVRDARDPVVEEIARRIRTLPARDRAREAFDTVVRTMPYVTDPGRELVVNGGRIGVGPDAELVIAPRYTLSRQVLGGDCDDMSTALVSILTALGIQAAFKVAAWRRFEFTHVYVTIRDPETGRTIPLDPVHGPTGYGWEIPRIIRSKTYEVPMRELVTLEDGPMTPCPCGGLAGLSGCGCGRRRGGHYDRNQATNNITVSPVINIPFAPQGNVAIPIEPMIVRPALQRPAVMAAVMAPVPATVPAPRAVPPAAIVPPARRIPAFLGPAVQRRPAFTAA